MFHRMKSEAPAPQNTAPSATQTQAAQTPSNEFRQQQNGQQGQQRDQNRQQNHQANQKHNQQSRNPSPSTQPAAEEVQLMNTNQNAQNAQANEDNSSARAQESAASPYQRPGQAPVRAAGGGFPGAAYAPAGFPGRGASPVTPNAPAGERKLTIGRGIAVSGEIESCDHLIVEGTLEAALKGASVLEIAENGTFYGTVDIEEATIAGRFEGDITVHGRLTIRASGTITGSIAYKELEVEAGAVIEGRLTPVGAAATAQGAENRKQNQQGGNKHNNKQQNKDNRQQGGNQAANNDEGLFSAKAAAE